MKTSTCHLSAPSVAFLEVVEKTREQHPGMLVLFRHDGHYEAFGQDALALAVICGLELIKRGELSMCWFPRTSLDTHLRQLLRAGNAVALCDPGENV